MSTGALIGIIIVVIVIAALVVAAVVALGALRRARLQRQFGPEYDRLVKARGKKKAEAGISHALVAPEGPWDEARFDAVAAILPDVHAIEPKRA